ncbi:MAG: alpha-hydroxy-acid oxidizing protein [Acidimicrobiales bacterium]
MTGGRPPQGPSSLADCLDVREVMALGAARLDPEVLAYVAAGSGDEETLADNEAAFGRRALRPRVLADLTGLTTASQVLGHPVAAPIGIAPTAEHGLVHPDAEAATARAAAAAGVPYCVSTASTLTLEEVAAAAAGRRWLQLYVSPRRAETERLVGRALAAGCEAVVLTVDVSVVGPRDRERAARRANPDHPYYRGRRYLEPGYDAAASGFRATWADLAWLRDLCDGRPLVVKGVMTGEDAAVAADAGAAAVWVSNHGGRQLDRSPATLDVLEEVVAAVDRRAEVYLDGGVRRGVDVACALALGARCVFVGRPVVLGLAAGGERGVATVLELLRHELEVTMALLGAPTVADLGKDAVRRR